MRRLVVLLAAVGALLSGVASANPVEDFYKGKTITLINAADVGGGIDVYSRVVAPFLAAAIPGKPNIIVQNMPGAGGVVAANYLYTVAAKDGTVVGMTQSDVPFAPLFSDSRFDASKFEWLGSFDSSSYLCVAWHTSPVKKFEDLLSHDLVVGSTGATATNPMTTIPFLMDNLFGTRFSVVSGYKGGSEIYLAMERGEVQGRCGLTLGSLQSGKPDWLKSKQINFLVQMSREPSREPELANVPTIFSFAKDEQQKAILEVFIATQEMTRPIFAPPGIPQDRAAALRAAFDAIVSDPKLKTQIEEKGQTMNSVSGTTAAEIVRRAYATPRTAIDATIKATQAPPK
jgi:tripartite-type tricarboxylate transporter receptor subunit TctC